MKFKEILNIFKNEVEPLFAEHRDYMEDHIIRFCFSAYMLCKFLNKRDRILDVGGVGIFAFLMKKLNYENITLLGRYNSDAIEKFSKLGLSFLLCENFDEDKIESKHKFDAIILFEIIEHLFDPSHLLLQLFDLCEEEGKIFCTTPNIASSYSISRLKKFENPYCFAFYSKQQLDICHKREFTPIEIKRIMKFSGFNFKYLTTFRSDNYLERKDVIGMLIKCLLLFKDVKFLERKDLRGRTIFYVGIKGSQHQQIRFPEDFYRTYV